MKYIKNSLISTNVFKLQLQCVSTISFYLCNFLDIDECQNGEIICGTKTSQCQNTNGSYECTCIQGYIKNGTECKGEHH